MSEFPPSPLLPRPFFTSSNRKVIEDLDLQRPNFCQYEEPILISLQQLQGPSSLPLGGPIYPSSTYPLVHLSLYLFRSQTARLLQPLLFPIRYNPHLSEFVA